MSLEVIKYERIWIDGLNRGDVSPTDETFASNCIIHMAGAPEPNLSIKKFKELVTDGTSKLPGYSEGSNDFR